MRGADAGLHAAEHAHHAVCAAGHHHGIHAEGARGRRHVDVIFLRILRERREHADHGVRFVVHAEHFADHGGIAAEAAQPVFVAEEKDGRGARFFVVGGKISADQRLGAEDVEIIPGDNAGFHLLRFGAAEEDELHVVVLNDGVEAAIPSAVVHQFRDGNAAPHDPGAGGGLAKHQQALAVLVGERLEEDGVDDAEDGGVGADAEAEHDDGGDGEAEIFAHHAQGEE